jgi:hypothetical protein
MNLKDILSSNVYLSITLGVLISVIHFMLNRNNPDESRFKKHLKLTGSAALLIYLGLYLKGNNNLSGGGSNPSSPWNTNSLEDINLDDPFKM